jgi:hypothetical protein
MIRTGLLIALICAVFSTELFAQVQVLLTIPPRPSPYLSDWQSRRGMASILIINSTTKTISAKLTAELTLNGSKVASTKFESMPTLSLPPGQSTYYGSDIFSQQAISFSGEVKQNITRTGMLPEGNYELCVSLLSAENKEQLTENCKNFSISTIKMPTLLAPADGTTIVSGVEASVVISWTPMIGSQSVNYRLRVVELLPSQDITSAIMKNQPVFERLATSTTQFVWPQEVHLPAQGGTFIWSIQPEDQSGTPLLPAERFAQPFKLIALPSKDQCLKLLTQLTEKQDSLIAIEENYWQSYELFLRLNKLYDDAELRADAYEIKKLQAELKGSEGRVAIAKQRHEAARSLYDAAVERYKRCIGR